MGIFFENNQVGKFSIVEESTNKESLQSIKEIMSNPESVNVYQNESINFVLKNDLERYMNCSGITDIEEALDNIANANSVSDDIFLLDESSIILEKSVEDDAMTVKQAKTFYRKVLARSRGKAESKEEIKARITVLKACVKDMENQQDNPMDDGGIVKYILKDFIPFNRLYRLIKRQDAYAGLAILYDMLLPGLGTVMRGVHYKDMLEANIKKTNETIEFLEDKLKEMK